MGVDASYLPYQGKWLLTLLGGRHRPPVEVCSEGLEGFRVCEVLRSTGGPLVLEQDGIADHRESSTIDIEAIARFDGFGESDAVGSVEDVDSKGGQADSGVPNAASAWYTSLALSGSARTRMSMSFVARGWP